MKERLQNRNKKGSSLMFIIIAVAFVGILSTIILRVTIINVETKSTDRNIKKNFYSTETVMDALNIALENISKDAMQVAYVDLLENYADDGINTTDGNIVQDKFARKYLNNLIGLLQSGNKTGTWNYSLDDKTTYEYKIEVLKEYLVDVLDDDHYETLADFLDIEYMKDNNCKFLEVTFDSTNSDAEKYVTLKNVRVNYKEDDANTYITTDIKIVVPKLNFEGGNIYPDFTKYAIIGDDKVDAKTSVKNAVVNGNVYAGINGLNVTGQEDTLTIGDKSISRVITRGDINVQQTGGLTLGSSATPIEVWAENYRTSVLKGYETPAKLTVYGDSYIHDDLSLDGPYSDVAFRKGKYSGYSFNKDNTDDSNTEVNSMYSSAIMINGKHSSLFMGDDMTEILLGGRAFISRNRDRQQSIENEDGTFTSSRTDIPLGESISVKSNQNFYLVSNDDLAEGFTNPMPIKDYEYKTVTENKQPMSEDVKKTLRNYVNASEPVTNYVYSLSGDENAAMVYFYYNFKNQIAADRYFRDFCDKNEMAKKMVSSEYLKFPSGLDISISENLSLLTVGNTITFQNKKNGMKTNSGLITDENEDYFKKESIVKAAKYKSFQLTLTDSDWSKYAQSGKSSGDYGFDLDKKSEDVKTIFDVLITKQEKATDYLFVEEAKKQGAGGDFGFKKLSNFGSTSVMYKSVPITVNGKNVYAIFVAETDTNKENLTEVSLDELSVTGYNQANDDVAIIVSNCNIKMDVAKGNNFKGLVISQNTVSLSGSININAEPALLQNMFSAQKAREGSLEERERFLRYFVAFSSFSFGEDVKNAQDSVDFSSCIKYVNWKKNND